MKKRNILSTVLSGLTLVATQTSSSAAVVFAAEDFETDLGVWSIVGVGSRYTLNDATQPTSTTDGANTNNYAASGTSAARIRNGGGTTTPNSVVSSIFDISSGGVNESITISMNYEYYRGQGTRRGVVELSNDGGTSWMAIAGHQSSSNLYIDDPSLSGTVTIFEDGTRNSGGNFTTSNTSPTSSIFTDQMQVRITFDRGNSDNGRTMYIDDLGVSASVAPIPEPSSTALLGLGGLAFILRRRR